MRRPGIEPGPSAWKADILTTRPTTLRPNRSRTNRTMQTRISPYQAFAETDARLPDRPRGPMDKASVFGTEDCRFESYRGQIFFREETEWVAEKRPPWGSNPRPQG